MVVIVGSAGRGVEGGDAVKVQHEVFPVAHRGVALIARDPHCGGHGEERSDTRKPRGQHVNMQSALLTAACLWFERLMH